MFENLIESKRQKKSTLWQQFVSMVMHVALIFGAVKATQGAAEAIKEIAVDTTMVFLRPPPEAPPPPPQDVIVSANPPPQGFQVIAPPDNIPTEIPPVNLNERFDPKDFTGKGVEGGIGTGVVGGTGPVLDGQVFLAAEVDETPQAMNENGICNGKFPAVMQSAGIPGKVVMQFVVNVDGKVDQGTMKVVSSTHKAFEEPAREALARCPFKPGKSKGQPVRVLVQQSMAFKLGS